MRVEAPRAKEIPAIELVRRLGRTAQEVFYDVRRDKRPYIEYLATQLRDNVNQTEYTDSWCRLRLERTSSGIALASQRVLDDETRGDTVMMANWDRSGRLVEMLAVRTYIFDGGSLTGKFQLGVRGNTITDGEMVIELGGARDRLALH